MRDACGRAPCKCHESAFRQLKARFQSGESADVSADQSDRTGQPPKRSQALTEARSQVSERANASPEQDHKRVLCNQPACLCNRGEVCPPPTESPAQFPTRAAPEDPACGLGWWTRVGVRESTEHANSLVAATKGISKLNFIECRYVCLFF